MSNYYGVNRYVCDCLDEMRKCVKMWTTDTAVHGVSLRHMNALIEEAQTLVNRMESGLEEIHDFDKMLKEKRTLKKDIKKLRDEKESLGDGEEEETGCRSLSRSTLRLQDYDL